MIPHGWTIKRADKAPFKRIELSIEHGRGMRYATVVDSLARNPENILYMLAEDLLKGPSEIEQLRAEQVASVMPQIGPLLDAWDRMANDTKGVLKEEAPDLARVLAAISRAMDGAPGVATTSAAQPKGGA